MSYNFSQNWPLAQQCHFTVTNTRLYFMFPFIFIIENPFKISNNKNPNLHKKAKH